MSEAYRLFQQGLAALADGHADEAIAPLERARSMEPESMSILEALGTTYLRIGFYDRAADAFSTILDREPLDAYAHYCLARSLDRMGDIPGAHHHYRLATEFAPERRIYRDTLGAFVRRTQSAGTCGGSWVYEEAPPRSEHVDNQHFADHDEEWSVNKDAYEGRNDDSETA